MKSTKIAQYVADYEDAGVPLSVAHNVARFCSGRVIPASIGAAVFLREHRLTVRHCGRSYHFSLKNGDLLSYS